MTSLVRSSRDSMTSLFTLHVVFKGVSFKSKYLENLICQNGTKTNSINSAPQSLEYFSFLLPLFTCKSTNIQSKNKYNQLDGVCLVLLIVFYCTNEIFH